MNNASALTHNNEFYARVVLGDIEAGRAEKGHDPSRLFVFHLFGDFESVFYHQHFSWSHVADYWRLADDWARAYISPRGSNLTTRERLQRFSRLYHDSNLFLLHHGGLCPCLYQIRAQGGRAAQRHGSKYDPIILE